MRRADEHEEAARGILEKIRRKSDQGLGPIGGALMLTGVAAQALLAISARLGDIEQRLTEIRDAAKPERER